MGVLAGAVWCWLFLPWLLVLHLQHPLPPELGGHLQLEELVADLVHRLCHYCCVLGRHHGHLGVRPQPEVPCTYDWSLVYWMGAFCTGKLTIYIQNNRTLHTPSHLKTLL